MLYKNDKRFLLNKFALKTENPPVRGRTTASSYIIITNFLVYLYIN